ncbi:MAG: GAF domain-containing SpoIIE family protein phosphatase [Candidatus Zixiibacteriota bacterium]
MSTSCALETRVTDLEDQLELKQSELNDIASMGVMLTSMLDIEAILSAMMEMSLRIVSAEVGCILIRDNGELETRISWGVDGSHVKKIKAGNDIDLAQAAYDSARTIRLNEIPKDSEVSAIVNSVICVPVTQKSEPIGVLVAVNKTNGEGFSDHDVATLERLVNFAAVAIENANMMKEILKKQKLEQELSLAKDIQRALLPNLDIDLRGASIGSLYLPAGKVGGDYFDLIPISDKEFVVIVGDVSNKGVPAALMMTAVRSVIRSDTYRGKDVASIVTHTNRIVCEDVMRYPNIFISFVYAYFDLAAGTCTYTNAGHLPPFIHNKYSGELRQLTTGGIIVGQFEDFEYMHETIDLVRGDRILLFTDGVTECVNRADQMYGREELEKFFAARGDMRPQELVDQLKTVLDEFTLGAGESQFDDTTAVVVEIEG